MGKYKKSWILLHEQMAKRAIQQDDAKALVYKNEVYSEISALMAEIASNMLRSEVKDNDAVRD